MWSRNSWLPVGPRSGDSIWPQHRPGRSSGRGSTTLSIVAWRTAAIADDAAGHIGGSRLELRLDQGHDLALAGERGASRRARTRVSEMNDTSMTARLTGSGSATGSRRRRIEPGSVRALHRDDARIAAQHLGQLSASHVESIDACRAALQEDIGEATGRGADVETHAPAHVDPESLERRVQLLAAARHEARPLDELDLDRRRRPSRPALQVAARPVARADANLRRPSAAARPGRDRARGRARRPGRRAARVALALVLRRSFVSAGRARRRDVGRAPESDASHRLADLLGDARRVDAQVAAQVADRAVVDEMVGRQADEVGPAARAAIGRPAPPRRSPRARPSRSHRSTTLSSSVTMSFLPRALARISSRVERLGEASVDDADRPAIGGQRDRRPPCRA